MPDPNRLGVTDPHLTSPGSAPEIFIGRALGETSSIRLGPAPVCLNQHHPGHVAARLAFLDHLSKGRLNLCFGPGSVTTNMELYGAEPKAESCNFRTNRCWTK